MLEKLSLVLIVILVIINLNKANTPHEFSGKNFYVITDQKAYQQAYDFCLTFPESSKLVIFTTTSRNTFVNSLLPAGTDDYYIGMYKETDGEFYWVSTILDNLIPVTTDEWNTNEPLYANGDCVAIILDNGSYKWQVTDCVTQRQFICEEDIDECALGMCGVDQCSNTYGSYSCTSVATTTVATTPPQTTMVTPAIQTTPSTCATTVAQTTPTPLPQTTPTSVATTATQTTPVPPLLVCKKGFRKYNATTCKDIDECQNSDLCSKYNGNCINFPGDYYCGCLPSETGPGFKCKPYCHENKFHNYIFPDTLADYISITANSTCKQGHARASMRCVTKYLPNPTNMVIAEFQTFNKIDCDITLDSIASKPINAENLETILGAIQLIASPIFSDVNQIEKLQQTLRRISNAVKTNQIEVSVNTAVYSVAAFSHLSHSLSLLEDEKKRIQSPPVSLLEDLLDGLNRNKATNLSANTDFMIFQTTQFQNPSYNFTFYPEIKSSSGFESPVLLTLPNEVYSKNRGHNYTTTVTLFKGSHLFPSIQKSDWVVAASVGVNETILNLLSPVVYRFNNQSTKAGKSNQNQLTVKLISHLCVFWDHKNKEWSKDGCCLDTTQTPPVCKCNHLTNFALLVSIQDLPADLALNVFSKVGCSFSIISYLGIIIIFLQSKKIRVKLPTRLQLHVFANLLVAYTIFLFGTSRVGKRSECTMITALLHFSLLTSWMWMAIYSKFLYSSLVTVQINIGLLSAAPYLLKCYLFAYGIPFIIVSGNLGATLGYFDTNLKIKDMCFPELDPLVRSYYLSDHMCWIHSYSLYCFLSIVGAVLISNTFVVVRVAIVFATRPKIRSSARKKSRYRQMKIAFTISIILGLNWVLGYFMLVSTDVNFNNIMSWCFSATSAFQGVFAFLVCCVFRPEILETWLYPIINACKGLVTKKVPKLVKLANGTLVPRENFIISFPIPNTQAMFDSNYSDSTKLKYTQQTELSDARKQMSLVLKELKSGPLQKKSY